VAPRARRHAAHAAPATGTALEYGKQEVFGTMNRGTPDQSSVVDTSRFDSTNPSLPPASRGTRIIRRALIAAAVGMFGAAAALGMVQPSDHTALPPARQVSDHLTLSGDAVRVGSLGDDPYVSETRIRPGDTLAAILARLEVDAPGLQAFLTRDPSARSIYKLYPGRSVQAASDADGKLVWLRYVHTPGNDSDGEVVTRLLQVEPQGEGYVARELTQATESQVRVAVGTIRSSLFGATDAAEVPDAVTLQMANILSSKIDFLRDLRQGDQFRVVYQIHTHDGRYAGAGRVLALEFVNRGKTYNAVWFDSGNGSGSYYDFEGNSLRGAFLRTALEFSRISSTFGMRMHPIHKKWVGHKGVDYAAPRGTPIHATADGTVAFAGVQNGYGNVVILQHYGKYSTVYAHQSRIAPGIKKGAKVSQGQLIGYVGSTGWATGPHLHYELRIAGTPVNPLSVNLPVAQPLDKKAAQAFAQAVQPYKEQIELLAKFQQTMPESLAAVAKR